MPTQNNSRAWWIACCKCTEWWLSETIPPDPRRLPALRPAFVPHQPGRSRRMATHRPRPVRYRPARYAHRPGAVGNVRGRVSRPVEAAALTRRMVPRRADAGPNGCAISNTSSVPDQHALSHTDAGRGVVGGVMGIDTYRTETTRRGDGIITPSLYPSLSSLLSFSFHLELR
jgi:hypothetical protein